MKNKKIIGAVIALVVVVLAMWGLYTQFGPKPVEGLKNVKIEVYLEEGTLSETFNVTTEEEFLGAVLLNQKIAQGEDGPYGLYIKTVCDRTVDESKQEWWCITTSGFQMVNTAPDTTPINDGDVFEIVLKVGY